MLDQLAPLERTVTVRGEPVTVRPLSLAQIGELVARFERLRDIGEGEDIATAVQQAGPEAVTEVIARATGESLETVRTAGLAAGEELDILTAAVNLTFPQTDHELGELIAQVLRLSGRVSGALGQLVPSA